MNGQTARAVAGRIGAGIIVSVCLVLTAAVVRSAFPSGHASPPSPPSYTVASAPPAQPTASGQVTSGTADCLFADGDEAYVFVGNTLSCSQWYPVLAGYGVYWQPLRPDTNGIAVTRYACDVSGAGGMRVVVSETAAATGSADVTTSMICTSLESDGWTPEPLP